MPDIPLRKVGDFEFDTVEGRLVRLEHSSASLVVFDKASGRVTFSMGPAALTVLYELLRNWHRFPPSEPTIADALAKCGQQRLGDLNRGPLPPLSNRTQEVETRAKQAAKLLPEDEFRGKKFDV